MNLSVFFFVCFWNALTALYYPFPFQGLSRRGTKSLSGHKDSSKNSIDSPWASVVSVNDDLKCATNEIISKIKTLSQYNSYSAIIVFVSSIYEQSSFKYQDIDDIIRREIPTIDTLIGCTTGTVVGPLDEVSGLPSEVESRASIGCLLISLGESDRIKSMHVTSDEISLLINSTSFPGDFDGIADDSVLFMLSTDNSKKNFGDVATKISDITGASIFGAVASAVTSLQVPKLFLSRRGSGFEKYTTGICLLALSGDFTLNTFIARSCAPVGPMFGIKTANANSVTKEIMLLERDDIASLLPSRPPLVQLDDVLTELATNEADALKRELLVGLIPGSPSALRIEGVKSILSSPNFFAQEPLSFDPITGSITVPSLPLGQGAGDDGVNGVLQFCTRDTNTARADLRRAVSAVKCSLLKAADTGMEPLAMIILGSSSRGSKLFRFNGFESLQVYSQLQEANFSTTVPVFGFLADGALTRIDVDDSESGPTALTETDAVFAFLTRKPKRPISNDGIKRIETAAAEHVMNSLLDAEDVLTASEKPIFSEDDPESLVNKRISLLDGNVIVRKRDPSSAHAVRVASMEYMIPEKIPLALNVLESLVWDRDKDIDRMKERLPVMRALSLAKIAEGKYPKRDFKRAISEASRKAKLLSPGGAEIPPVIVTIAKASIHNGKLRALDTMTSHAVMAELAKAVDESGAVCAGCNVDSAFGGAYDDIGIVKLSCSLPVVCDDFVLYGYQLFVAKANGADAIRLHASVLSCQDLEYFIKTAKAIGLSCIVVTSTKAQVLDVIRNVPSLSLLSVSSRNMHVWKIDAGKAARILRDVEVREAIAQKRREDKGGEASDIEFMLLQEAFTSPEELAEATSNGVDAVILGEELINLQNRDLHSQSSSVTKIVNLGSAIEAAIKAWMPF